MANPPTQADLIAQAKRLAALTKANVEANPPAVNGPVVASPAVATPAPTPGPASGS